MSGQRPVRPIRPAGSVRPPDSRNVPVTVSIPSFAMPPITPPAPDQTDAALVKLIKSLNRSPGGGAGEQAAVPPGGFFPVRAQVPNTRAAAVAPRTPETQKQAEDEKVTSTPGGGGSYTCKDDTGAGTSHKYDSEDADYEIISSDKVLYKVHTYRLQAASQFFITTLKNKFTTKRLPLFDTTLEHSSIIEIILDAIYLSEINGCEDIMTAYRVINLAEKWECLHVLKLLKRDLALQSLALSVNGPRADHFRLALKLGDYHLMGLLVQRERDTTVRLEGVSGPKQGKDGILPLMDEDVDRLYDTPSTGLSGTSELRGDMTLESPMYELGGLGYTEFLRLPPTVVWALLRSTYLARRACCEVSVDMDQMSKQFEGLLHQAYTVHAPIPAAKAAVSPATIRLEDSASEPLEEEEEGSAPSDTGSASNPEE